jgi:UTP-glucose-1-phosphate uridylyltransferase
MKTAMQEHIEWLKEALKICKDSEPTLLKILELALTDAQNRLNEEKKQIIYAFDCGIYDGGENVSHYNMNAEQYYNETFNK